MELTGELIEAVKKAIYSVNSVSLIQRAKIYDEVIRELERQERLK